MSEKDNKKYYYIKLHTNFFDKHFMKIMEKKDPLYALAFVKLLCEACVHRGELRFSKDVPYTVDDLAVITGSDQKAIDYYIDKGLLIQRDDGTFYIEYAKLNTGEETGRTRRNREKRLREDGENFTPNDENSTPETRDQRPETRDKNKGSSRLPPTTTEKFTNVWNELPSEKMDKLREIYQDPEELVDAVHEYVKLNEITITKSLYRYIVGYASNHNWPKVNEPLEI